MTDPDDRVRRRYREIATEEPSAVIDAAILARARAARPARSRWMGPVSIAAVLVLGIGVSLRMQLEQPGIETSAPTREAPAPASEYSLPPSAEPAPPPAAPAVRATDAATKPAAPPQAALQKRIEAVPPPPQKPLADAVRAEPGPAPAPAFVPSPPAERMLAAPAAPPAAPASAPPPAAAQSRADEAAPALARVQEAPAALGATRAKREAANLDTLGARELRKSAAPDPDPARELERIAKLREEGHHAEADTALAEFRKRHPEHRIPEAVWERVKPR